MFQATLAESHCPARVKVPRPEHLQIRPTVDLIAKAPKPQIALITPAWGATVAARARDDARRKVKLADQTGLRGLERPMGFVGSPNLCKRTPAARSGRCRWRDVG
jgi:hypothetical protein